MTVPWVPAVVYVSERLISVPRVPPYVRYDLLPPLPEAPYEVRILRDGEERPPRPRRAKDDPAK